MSTMTSKTIDDAILEARLMVNDSQIPYRNSDTVYLQYYNSALRALYSLRPDAFIGNFSTGILSTNIVLTYTTADLQEADGVPNPTPPVPAEPFPADDRFFFSPVVAYMAGRIELADDEYVESSRSTALLTAFAQQLKGP